MARYEALERDVGALIKAVLFEIEEAASQPPEVAANPAALEQRRKRVIARIWMVARTCMALLEKRGDT